MHHEIDSLICLLRYYLRADMALLSVIDDTNNRQIFRAHCGLTPEYEAHPETPLSRSFCLTVRDTGNTVVVNDARLDPRFCRNPAIDALHVVGFLGAPVFEEADRPIGAACVISGKPRAWSADEVKFLYAASGMFTKIIRRMH